MKRATLIALFVALLFVLGITLLFRSCNAPKRVNLAPFPVQLHAHLSAVPEPSTYCLWGVGAITLVILTRKRH